MIEYVTLVDENDNVVGSAEKIDAHRNPRLHRAFSIFIVNSNGELLIQQRAAKKYHCPGMWANTCCGHPRPGELLEDAAHRRLREEMGFDTGLVRIFSFIYKTEFNNGLTEMEYDHVFVGKWDGIPKLNKDEAADYKWIQKEFLEEDIKNNPEIYASWFKIAWNILLKKTGNGFIKDALLFSPKINTPNCMLP